MTELNLLHTYRLQIVANDNRESLFNKIEELGWPHLWLVLTSKRQEMCDESYLEHLKEFGYTYSQLHKRYLLDPQAHKLLKGAQTYLDMLD